MKKPTILFVEENENTLSNRIGEDSSINLIFLRFKQNSNFTKKYLEKTKKIKTFILDKEMSLESEILRFNKFCKTNKIKIDYFYNDSEYNQELVQEFAYKLKLKNSLNKRQAILVRDKAKMKEWLNKIGFKTMKYSEVSSIDDVIKFTKNISNFPIIIKWKKGLSSIEVYKIENMDELLKLNLDYSSNRFIVEEYCPYVIWCVDSLVQNGKVIYTFITWLPYTNLNFAEKKEKFAQITVDNPKGTLKFNTGNLNQKIINNLRLKNGYIHLEAFIDKKGNPIICEFAWRTPGEHMLSNHSKAFNMDVYSFLINIITGRKIMKIRSKETFCVGDMFLPVTNGIVKNISKYEDFKNIKGVLDGEIKYNIGDKIITKRQYTDSSGWLQIKAKTKEEVLKIMIDIYKKYIIEMK